jgi:hypothetical protein
MAMTEDFSVFFSLSEFADTATLAGVEVQGVLESGYEHATLDGFGDAAGTSPRYTLPAAQVPARAAGQVLQVTTGPGAGRYRISNAYPDGTGLVTLHLIRN